MREGFSLSSARSGVPPRNAPPLPAALRLSRPKILLPSRIPVLLLLLAGLAAELPAQQDDARESGPPTWIVEHDIRTSSLTELAAWNRSLGLPEGGTAEALARRLREYYGLDPDPPETAAEDTGRKIITIESARSTEYFTIQAIDEEYARLTGDVVISLRDGDALHRIEAWELLFNRTRNIITASGGVVYRKTQGDTVETFRGDSITVDLDNWSSIFTGGISERALEGEGGTYLFSGTVISRDDEEATVLRGATISRAGEESLWSLDASRVWLLPGSDFAIANAVLKVGHVPVMYIPFFFFPADQMLFHPAIGTRTREGNFVNTTTYILGRPTNEGASESSLVRIMGGGEDMERRREGVFLRSTGRKVQGEPGPTLAVLVDYYTNLGAYFGTEFSLPRTGILNSTSLSMGIALSRTLYQQGNTYTPFWPDFDGMSDWNRSRIFGLDVPFRYRFLSEGSLGGTFGSLSWRLPLYSDPMIDGDFMTRLTTMDWIDMIRQGASALEDTTTGGETQISPPTWELTATVRPRFPATDPYLTVSNNIQIRSSLAFRTVTTQGLSGSDIMAYSPMRFFFAPNTSTLYSISGLSFSGTPFRLPATAARPSPRTDFGNPLEEVGEPISPFLTGEEGEPEAAGNDGLSPVPPVLNQTFTLPVPIRNTSVSFDYTFTPSGGSTLRFDGIRWGSYEEVDWNRVESVVTNILGTGNLRLSSRLYENLLTNTFTLSGNGHWRTFSFLNEDAEEFKGSGGETDPEKITARKLQEHRQTHFTTSYLSDTSFRPLQDNAVFGNSRLQYQLGGLAVRSEFVGTGDDPEWEPVWGKWDRERITQHQMTGRIEAVVRDKSQSLSATGHLPPRERMYTANSELNIWITRTTGSWGIRYPEDEDPRHEPFNLNHTITFPRNFGNFTQTLRMNTEERHLTNLGSTLSLSAWGLTSSFRMERIKGKEFVSQGEWGEWRDRDAEPKLLARDFQIEQAKRFDFAQMPDGGTTFSVDLNARMLMDLQEYTRSNLTFAIGASMTAPLTTIRIRANSDNNEIFRYFRNTYPFNTADIFLPDGPQNNFFLDLINSFRFDREDLRQLSGFKIRSFTVGATRALGDWTASLDWTMAPRQHRPPGERMRIEMTSTVSFMVQWIPISEFRSSIGYDSIREPKWQVQGL
ncbi:MAG: LPS-assembly protein LptD [Treponema sp.]|nr:LPS-assembly protein LptD [Treponema sp.]